MNERKDIDRLFQEKFKDFEVTPPEFVWENIQEALQEKKKRRIVPLWIKLSGIAAILVMGGLLVTLYFNSADNTINNNPVVIDNAATTPADALKTSPAITPASPSGTNSTESESSNANTAVASGEENTNASGTNANNVQGTTINNSASPVFNNDDNAVANGSDKNDNAIDKKTGKRVRHNAVIQQNDAVAAANKKQGTSGKANPADVTSKTNMANNNTNEGLAVTKEKASINNQTVTPNGNLTKEQKDILKNTAAANEGVAVSKEKSSINNQTVTPNGKQDKGQAGIINDAVPANESVATAKTDATSPANAAQDQNNTIIDKDFSATESGLAQAATDTTIVMPENELEKLLQEKINGKNKEEEAVAEVINKSKWNVKPQVAPIFYSSLSDGSPINEQFASNDKSYDNDLSFGIGVNYALTDRITIRSGINTVNLNYATNDIAYHASLNAQTTNISESKTANIVVMNPGDAVEPVFIIDGMPTQAVSGSMVQKTGYVEVPLEMSYALVNKKFGVDIIGGVSTLFLNQNNVSVVSSEGLRTEVGQAENLNNVHFSTNVGLGFKYRFWDSFQMNFEPMFKYQVNTFSRDAGNFKPYFIGLYSGISFSF